MSIVEQAKVELALISFGEDDTRVMVEILEKFFDQWDSGGAVHAVAPILQRCIAGKPLSPLTGADSEWVDHGNDVFQNMRCGTVFKERCRTGGWITYDIDRAPLPDGKFNPDHHRWAPCEITFPYIPEKSGVSSPVVVIETEDRK